jgi:hypothetical protein
MNGLGGLDGLRDIRGLDDVSVWPLAPGWWLLLGLLVLFLAGVLVLRRISLPSLIGPRDWRMEARRLLRDLRRRLPMLDGREAAGEFSELMRRIAMARTSRDECAGLSGTAWLDWLSTRDPTGFDWREYGRVLIEVPYAPPGSRVDPEDLRRLFDAAGFWVDPPREAVAASPVREAA